jgi:hypothetical protein
MPSATTLSQPEAESMVSVEFAPDAPLRFGPRPRRRPEEPLLNRPIAEALSGDRSPASRGLSDKSQISEPELPSRPWGLTGWLALGVGAPSLLAVAIVIMSPVLRPPTPSPVERADRGPSPQPVTVSRAPPPATSPFSPISEQAVYASKSNASLESEREASLAQATLPQTNSAKTEDPDLPRPLAVLADQPAVAPVELLGSGTATEEERGSIGGELKTEASPAEIDHAARKGESIPLEENKSTASDAVAATPATSSLPPPRGEHIESPVAPTNPGKDIRVAATEELERDQEPISAGLATPSGSPAAVLAERSDAGPSSALTPLPEGMPAHVSIRYSASSTEARRRAEDLAKVLITGGIEVADLRASATPIKTYLSYSYRADQSIAQRVGRLAGIAPTQASLTKDGLLARPGTIQINIWAR